MTDNEIAERLPRYGFPVEELTRPVPTPDGYWTPWHIAKAIAAELLADYNKDGPQVVRSNGSRCSMRQWAVEVKQERDEALRANSMLIKAASDMEEQRDAARAEVDSLRTRVIQAEFKAVAAHPNDLLDVGAICEQRDAARAERDRLQIILDSRPAINAGLPETYIQWSNGIYIADIGKAVGHN